MSAPFVLITGGSRGIGAATARLAAARGYDVAFSYATDERAARGVFEAIKTTGRRVLAVKADLAREADLANLFREVDGFGRLTHLVNSAGVTGKSSRLDAADPKTIRDVIDLNLTSAILVAREAVRRLSRRNGGPGGAIVNVSSAASTIGGPGEYVWYAATKGAMDAFTLGLSKELATEGVRVNAVLPGLIDTDIHAVSTGEPGRVKRMTPMIPMNRSGTADEVAEAILWLLSPEASYVTGALLRVAGGR